jgi:ABC-2 type transport system permease protein
MRALWAVYKREVALFFRSGVAYAIAFGLLFFMGVLFSASLWQFVVNNTSGFSQQLITANVAVVNTLGTLTFLLFIIAPLLTMRLISEETREGTLEVLMTLPMGDWAFVVGKFLAVWTFYTVLLLITLVYVFILAQIGVPDTGIVFSAYLGAWLYGGLTLAVSLIWSAVSEDQIVAAFLGAASILVLYLADGVAILANAQSLTANAADFIRELSLNAHYQDTMLQGIVRAEDVLYFLLMMAFALFLTTLMVGTRRWRAS